MPANFSLQSFISAVATRGMARTNRYEVAIVSPSGTTEENTLTSLFCEISALPGMNIAVKPYKIFGPSYQMPLSAEYNGEGLAMTFLLDSNMMVKRFFDDWMHLVSAPGYFHVNYRAVYARDILIRQLDEGSAVTGESDADGDARPRVTYATRLVGAFPRSMNLVDLNHTTADLVHRLTVIFAYRYWETVDNDFRTGTIEMFEAGATPFNPFTTASPITFARLVPGT